MLEVQFGPLGCFEIVQKSFISDHEFAWMRGVVPEMETAPPKRTALVVETMVKVCPNLGAGISPVTLTLSTCNFFI